MNVRTGLECGDGVRVGVVPCLSTQKTSGWWKLTGPTPSLLVGVPKVGKHEIAQGQDN